MTTTSQTQNQQNSFSPNNTTFATFTLEELHEALRIYGCHGCELGCQDSKIKPVLCRGNPQSGRMIIGEAPGLDENIQGRPFTGPAGQLLDKMFQAISMDTNTDWYLGNIVKCRPIAPSNSGKQNSTPTAYHRTQCLPYIEHEVNTINPSVVVLLGRTATNIILGKTRNQSMQAVTGKIFYRSRWPHTIFYPMYHPAYILHSKGNPEKMKQIRMETWEHLKKLRKIINAKEQ